MSTSLQPKSAARLTATIDGLMVLDSLMEGRPMSEIIQRAPPSIVGGVMLLMFAGAVDVTLSNKVNEAIENMYADAGQVLAEPVTGVLMQRDCSIDDLVAEFFVQPEKWGAQMTGHVTKCLKCAINVLLATNRVMDLNGKYHYCQIVQAQFPGKLTIKKDQTP